MASQDYPPGFGDEEVQGGGTDWWEGNQLDGGDGGPGPGNMNGATNMGNGNNMGVNNNGNNGNGPPPRPQNSNSPPSTTNSPTTTSSYDSAISTNTITTTTAAASTTSSSPSASYISPTSINTNTTSTVDTSYSSTSSSYFSTPTPTITPTSSNSSTLLAPTTSISSTTTTTSSSTIDATLMSNTGAGTQSVGVTILPSTTSIQHGLSKGSIAGITIGSLALLALILTAIWYFLRRKKKNKQHRKSIGGFGVAEWNGSGMGGNMTQVNESPAYAGKITAGMGVQRILTWNTMRSLTGTHTRASSSISQTPSTPSTASQSTLQNPFTDQPHFSSFSFPFSPAQQPKTPDQPTSNVKTVEEGPHEDIVDFGDSIDWIRKRDRMRDRERSGLTGPDLGSGMGEGKPDWRYSVRVNGGGNNL
ncbi:uncharacterized protein Bfra_004403 [Botrytis fragariae]|uniref:REJ domain-containing protein n=1 Tax=Botrytis fragariae TaxID=1964551 RepID=A0A8H6EJC6_9HELO|nr:uncharacterized protein Bfra_004403 [Botrytis fragariae]KAF5874396.1 hypothetical protein Bfra_004403 [Botrytis fragariae]